MDGLGMGLGFTLALTLMASVREIFGAGSWFGIKIPYMQSMTLFILPAGGFFVLGCIIAFINRLSDKKPPENIGCSSCPANGSCSSCSEGGRE